MKRIIVFSVIVLLLSVFLTSGEIYKIIKPDSSSKWARGSTKAIKWDKKGDTYPNVKIRLYTSPGNVKAQDISNSTNNNGSFEWKIPAGTALGKYFVRVKTLNNLNWGDGDEFEIVSGSTSQFNLPTDVMKKVGSKPVFKPSKGMFDPKIEFVIDHPLGPLRPGTRVVVKGKNFLQNKGKVLVKGNFPGGQFQLENVNWESNTRVLGYVPQSVNGQPNQDVKIVLVNMLNKKSNEWSAKFEGRDVKILTQDVVGVQCGTDGNWNTCNKFNKSDAGFSIGFDDNHAICGYHSNEWAVVGNDSGSDMFTINLKNGWVLKNIEVIKWELSSEDEFIAGPEPPFPPGQSVWNAVIRWEVTPNDHIWYEFKIWVEGPWGTNYK